MRKKVLIINYFWLLNLVIVTGQSAGALASYTWANWFQDFFKLAEVLAVPDCGIFMDVPYYKTGFNDYRYKL